MSTLKEQLIAAATIVGTVVGCVAFGYSIGKDTNDGLVNFLREKNQLSEKTEAQLHAEISSLKLELQSSKSVTSSVAATLSASGTATSSAAASLSTRPAVETNSESFSLRAGETARPFNGKIAVSLVGIKFDGDPLRYKIFATIGAPGKENKSLDKADVGYAVVFEGYEVRVVASDTFSATFLVTRITGKT